MFKYTAIIVEPRKHQALSFVLHNFLENLSDEWGFVIFHGSQNVEYVENIINDLTPSYKSRIINKVNLGMSNLNSVTYSTLFATPNFYTFIPTETFLVFQIDSIILSKNKELLHQFIEYDYVGAPWRNKKVGNGGLSLRKKSKMLEILRSKKYKGDHEDMFFSINIPESIKYHVAPYEVAKKFSIETVYDDSPFGVHNCWSYFHASDTEKVVADYPEVGVLIGLQSSL